MAAIVYVIAKVNNLTSKIEASTVSTKSQSLVEEQGNKRIQELDDKVKLLDEDARKSRDELFNQSKINAALTERLHQVELDAEKNNSANQALVADLRTQVQIISENRAAGQELLNMERATRERIEAQAKADTDALRKQVETLVEENKLLHAEIAKLKDEMKLLNDRNESYHQQINDEAAIKADRETYYMALQKTNESLVVKLTQLSETLPDLKDWMKENGIAAGNVNMVSVLTSRIKDKDSAIQSRDEHIMRLTARIGEMEKQLVTPTGSEHRKAQNVEATQSDPATVSAQAGNALENPAG